MRIRYNAPVTLSFAFLSSIVLLVDTVFGGRLTLLLFSVPGAGAFDWGNPLNYLRLVGHVAGHANWTHLMSNFAFILLLGPILEEKYRSGGLLVMLLVTAVVTGLLNALFLPQGLLGASGIVFMMILLSSFSNIRSGEIPLTFILIVVLYLTREVVQSFQENTISEFAHIAGGICGSLFGFLQPRKNAEPAPPEGV